MDKKVTKFESEIEDLSQRRSNLNKKFEDEKSKNQNTLTLIKSIGD